MDIIPGSNAKWNRKFLVFLNFQKKDNLDRLIEIFQTNFWNLSILFDFQPAFLGILVEWNAPNICLIVSKNMQQYVLYKETLAMLPIWTVDSPPKPKQGIQKLNNRKKNVIKL